MNEFLINEAGHKRWILPDGIHYYNVVTYGDFFHVSIWHRLENRSVLSHSVKIDPEGKWKDLLEMSQELANKRFPKEIRVRRDRHYS